MKLKPQVEGYKRHRLVIPVYIPHELDYYKDAFDIFCKCINSLIHTTDSDLVNITIIDNASIKKVEEFVLQLQSENKIDKYVKNLTNRGKADMIVAEARGCYEPFVTFSDADVLFEHGWLEALENGYRSQPAAGVICPFPAPHLKFHFTVTTWLKNFFFKIKWGKVVSDETLLFFSHSLGIPNFFKERDIRKQFYIKSKEGDKYLIGAGHFVATYRTEIFREMDYQASSMALKGGLKFIEDQVDQQGFMRLSLTENKVYHMGNQLEKWIHDRYMEITKTNPPERQQGEELPPPRPSLSRFLPLFVRRFVAKFITYSVILLQKR